LGKKHRKFEEIYIYPQVKYSHELILEVHHEFKTTVWRNQTPSDGNQARYIANIYLHI